MLGELPKRLTHNKTWTTTRMYQELAWLTHNCWHLHSLGRLHRLCWYNSWIKGLPIKLEHGILELRGEFNKNRYLPYGKLKPKYNLTCMKLYGPCICAMIFWTTCFLTTGSEWGVGVTGVSGWGSGRTGVGAVCSGCCMEFTTCVTRSTYWSMHLKQPVTDQKVPDEVT